MEWSKDKTMRLIQLMQANVTLWNPSLCHTRRDKQKRREELRVISDLLAVSVGDVTKKIQHLRTQYNRESARELRAKFENAEERYVSSWYAYEYVHFLKDSRKPYRFARVEEDTEPAELNPHPDSAIENKLTSQSPAHRTDPANITKPDTYQNFSRTRDDFSVFGEYVANELRSLKGEKKLLVAKKKILDVIFEVKIGSCEQRQEPTVCTVFTPTQRHATNNISNDKVYTAPVMSTTQIEPLTTHTTPTTGINEIIINSACHYSTFKVDTH